MQIWLAVCISLFAQSSNPTTNSDLRERFFSEAIPAYERAALLFETSINGRSETTDSATGAKLPSRILCRGDKRLIEFTSCGSDVGVERMVVGANGRYGFVLRGSLEGPLAIQEILTRAEAIEKGLMVKWPIPFESINHFSIAGWNPKAFFTHPGFSITSVSSEGPLVRVDFDFDIALGSDPMAAGRFLKSGTLKMDPDKNWRVVYRSLTFIADPATCFTQETMFHYKADETDPDLSMLPCSSESSTFNLRGNLTSKTLTTYSSDYSGIDVLPNQITLSAYGFPEPPFVLD